MFFRNQIIAQLFCTNADVQTPLVSPMHYASWIIRVIIKRLTDNHSLFADFYIDIDQIRSYLLNDTLLVKRLLLQYHVDTQHYRHSLPGIP